MNVCMRNILCLLAMLPLQVLAVPPKEARMEFYASTWAEVDTSGTAHIDHVEELSKLEDVPALAPAVAHIKELLKQRIESWQFVPATRDGIAVPSRTHVMIRLEGMDDGKGGLGLRIRSASTGASFRDMLPPLYPPGAFRSGREGRVLLVVDYDEDGKVVDVTTEETQDIYSGKMGGPASTEFKRAAIKAARNWTIENETVAGRPKAGKSRIPVTFCLSDACMQLPETEPDMPRDGELVAIDPAVKLRSAVAGTAL